MNYELAHDTIARQIFEKASTEARTRRKVEKYIKDKYEAYQLREAKLSQDDIDYIKPYLSQVNISPKEEAFYERSKQHLQAAKRKRQLLTAVIGLILVAAAGISMWFAMDAQEQAELANEQRHIAQLAEDKAEESQLLAEEKERDAVLEKQHAEAAEDQAQVEEARANQASKNAQRALRNLKSATSDIVKIVLQEAHQDVRNLHYEAALQKYRDAFDQKVRKTEVAKGIMELAFFYGHTRQLNKAQGLADTVAILLHQKSQKLQTYDDFHQALLRIDPLWGDSIYHRYYPRMIKVEGGDFTFQKGEELEKDTTVQTFYIGQTEVTNWQFYLYHAAIDSVIVEEPSWSFVGALPVVLVSWHQARAYANWLSERTGQSYQLPGEVEWEFAALGGKKHQGHTHSGSSDPDAVAWHEDNSFPPRPKAVMTQQPNEQWLYDMSGNVWEWSNDKHRSNSDQMATRGGSFLRNQKYCRAISRSDYSPNYPDDSVGFRLYRPD